MHCVLLPVNAVMATLRYNTTVYLLLGNVWDTGVQFDVIESHAWLEFVYNRNIM